MDHTHLMPHMHKRRGDNMGQLGRERRSRSMDHSVNTLECPRTNCLPHEQRDLGCRGECGSVYQLWARANPVIKS